MTVLACGIGKLLVANRGEIAVRVFRAAYELGVRTVAVHTRPDRASLHRLKADEAYEVGDPARPLAGYLDVEELVGTAVRVGADAIHPGYGFLSESPEFAAACEAAGLVFVGPPAGVLELTGDKIRARTEAVRTGIPVLAASDPVETVAAAIRAAAEIGYPVFVKAAGGGGGRGLRRVERAEDLAAAVETSMREAQSAFGNPTVFLEEALTGPRHVEVQVLADASGETVHLFERDCSVQRRHQKVVEIAPAPNLDASVRQALLEDAVAFARAVGYRNAGTVEFLVAPDGPHVFIEMNPRIQVEHTVTEEVTDVDLVQAQLRVAGGASLAELGLVQEAISCRGTAIQCRITTEDPAQGFRPDTGTIQAYRSASGPGVRLDAGSAYVGAEVSPYFDSMLVKLTARGQDLAAAARRADRALAEFRIRGVATNIRFLRALLAEPDFVEGRLSTAFIDERPHLTSVAAGLDRATRLLTFLADVTVNRPHGDPPVAVRPRDKLPSLPDGDPPNGWKQVLTERGPEGFAAVLRDQAAVAVTDTTMRDAHQSLLATRMRTADMEAVAAYLARLLPQLLSFEVWGGATYDVALRFLHEDPWQRLERLRAAIPNVCLQMLLRGQNAVGYSRYPPKLVDAFVAEAAATGVDVFRIFDAFNLVGQMRPAIDATLEAGAVAEGTLCYTGDLSHPGERLYTLDYYLGVAGQLVAAGVHVLCIKDMAGLLRAPAAHTLVSALRAEFELPVHLHTHDTAGGQLATYLAAVQAGVDAIDGAAAPLSGMTSQPSLAAIVAATDHNERATGLSLDALIDLEPYWEAVRRLYRPFEAGLVSPTGGVFRHEIPGGQLSNLRQQAVAMGLGERFEEIADLYTQVDRLLGGLIKVTPSSKVVGDLAIYLASSGITPEQVADDPQGVGLPASVLGFLAGDLGEPPGGWPEPLRTKALDGREPDGAAVAALSPQDEEELDGPARRQVLNRVLFPEPARDHEHAVERFGDVSVLPTKEFLYGLTPGEEVEIDLEPGVRLLVELEAITEPDARGRRTVLVKLNGQARPVEAIDRSLATAAPEREQADPSRPGHVAAPFTGVVTVLVGPGDPVEVGDRLATIEAMKMETTVNAPLAGRIERVAVGHGSQVEPGDLLLIVQPLETAEQPPERDLSATR